MTGTEMLGALMASAAILVTGGAAARAWLRLRGTRVITCPETHTPEAVELDIGHAALTAALGRRVFHLRDCSRWPEKAGCGQLCLSQIEESPQDCLVRNILGRWYADKSCALCGREFDPIHWHDHRPGLMAQDGGLVKWNEVPPEGVPVVLATHRPVCWDCLVTETFRRRYPELVVERPPRPHAH